MIGRSWLTEGFAFPAPIRTGLSKFFFLIDSSSLNVFIPKPQLIVKRSDGLRPDIIWDIKLWFRYPNDHKF